MQGATATEEQACACFSSQPGEYLGEERPGASGRQRATEKRSRPLDDAYVSNQASARVEEHMNDFQGVSLGGDLGEAPQEHQVLDSGSPGE